MSCPLLFDTRPLLPTWLAQVRQDLLAAGNRIVEEVRNYQQRLDALTLRVDEALRRAEAATPAVAVGLAQAVPWAADALAYLERRGADCPLPELFAALRGKHAELSLLTFHDGLRRLHDRKTLRLLPFTAPPEEIPEPEYALLDGAAVYYHAGR